MDVSRLLNQTLKKKLKDIKDRLYLDYLDIKAFNLALKQFFNLSLFLIERGIEIQE